MSANFTSAAEMFPAWKADVLHGKPPIRYPLGDGFERGFVMFATLLGLFSVLWGYRRHGAVRALGLLLPGLAMLWLAILYRPLHETLVAHALAMTLGGTLVGLAHMANLRLVHVHDASCAH